MKNCECKDSESWRKERGEVCMAIGDCGEGINFVGKEGVSEIKLKKIGRDELEEPKSDNKK